MTYRDMKLFIFSSVLAVLVLFSALTYSYVEIERREKSQVELVRQLNRQVHFLDLEKDHLKSQVDRNKVLFDRYEMLDQMIAFSQLEGSQMDTALQIAIDTPLDYKSALILVSYAEKYQVKPSLILAMIKKESGFNALLVGTHRDRGFLQIIPGTEKWLVEAYGQEMGLDYDPEKIFTPEYNLGLGIKYISSLLAQHKDPHRALSEYNRGPTKLAAYYAENSTYQTSYSRTIINQEKNFVKYDTLEFNK